MNFLRFLAFLRGCAAVGASLCVLTLATTANAQTVQVGNQTCTYTSFTYTYSPTSPGYIFQTTNCTPLDTSGATITIGPASTNLVTTAHSVVNVSVQCSGAACTGIGMIAAVDTVNVVADASSVVNGSGAVIVTGDGSMTTPLIGSVATLTLTLTGTTVTPVIKKSTGEPFPGTYPVVIAAVVIPPPAGCTADKTYDPGPRSLQTKPLLSGLQTAAIKFTPVRGPADADTGSMGILRAGVYGLIAPLGVQYQVSECPGDFTPNTLLPATRCGGYFAAASNATVKVTAQTPPPAYSCILDRTKSYYLNIRYVDPATGLTTCMDGKTCGVNVNFYW